MSIQPRHIAFFLPTFPAGGQEQTTLLLMKGLVERGHRVDLLLERKVGAYLFGYLGPRRGKFARS